MIFHSFLTDGFFDFGVAFVKSLALNCGEENLLILSTRNLTSAQIDELSSYHSNCLILNKEINFKAISAETGINVETLELYKYEIENINVDKQSHTNVIWKQYISVQDRYRNSLLEALEYAKEDEKVLHFDADSFIHKPINAIYDVLEKNDISITFQEERKETNRKVYGALIGLTNNKLVREFLSEWQKTIDSIPLIEKPLGYGQGSFYLTYLRYRDSHLSWGNFEKWYFSVGMNSNALIWSGNHDRNKNETAQLFNALIVDSK